MRPGEHDYRLHSGGNTRLAIVRELFAETGDARFATINAIVRERLIRDGQVKGRALESERLISRGYTHAEKSIADNYAPGDVVAFHRPYKRLGVKKGDELDVAGIDRDANTVNLRRKDGEIVGWIPHKLAARTGGAEVYRCESFELRAGDRIRWTKNDNGLGLINSQTADVTGVKKGTVTFALEDGRTLDLKQGDAQLRHIDRAWASTVHAFQGRTVDTVIAAMEANHPHLTTQQTLYVEISRARDRAELVTDDRNGLRERLEAVTGERIAALELIGAEKSREVGRDAAYGLGEENKEPEVWEQEQSSIQQVEKSRAANQIEHDLG